jgi:hypothetical protein
LEKRRQIRGLSAAPSAAVFWRSRSKTEYFGENAALGGIADPHFAAVGSIL